MPLAHASLPQTGMVKVNLYAVDATHTPQVSARGAQIEPGPSLRSSRLRLGLLLRLARLLTRGVTPDPDFSSLGRGAADHYYVGEIELANSKPIVTWSIDTAITHAVNTLAALAARPELTKNERHALAVAWCTVSDVQVAAIRRLYPTLSTQRKVDLS